MASSITSLNTSMLLSNPKESNYPSSHFTSNLLKFAPFPSSSSSVSRTPFSVSCSITRDPASVLPLQDHIKLENGSVVLQRPDSFGRFGRFGGKYVPETLMHALTELEAAFHSLTADEDFQVL